MPSTATIILISGGVLAVLALGLGLGLGLKSSDDDDVTTMAPMPDTTTTMAPTPDTTTTMAPMPDTTTTMAPMPDTTTMAPMPDTTTMAPMPDTTTTEIPDDMKYFTLQDYVDGTYKGKSINPNWAPSGVVGSKDQSYLDLYFETDDDANIWLNDFNTLEHDQPFAVNTKNPNYEDDWRSFSVSENAKYIFFIYNFRKIWRETSYYADHELYDVEKQEYVESIFDKPEFLTHCPEGKDMVMLVKWAPNDNAGVFVCGFNLYYFTDPSDFSTVVPITTDGKENEIYNGIPEWAYQEEIIGANNVVYFSPSGSQINFVKFTTQTKWQDNGSDAHIYKYSWYGEEQYPETLEISYAKAGTGATQNQMFVYDTTSKTTHDLQNLQPYQDEDNIFYKIDWNGDGDFLAVWTNRIQTNSEAVFFTWNSNDSKWETKSSGQAAKFEEANGWVGSFGPFQPYYDAEDSYLTIRSRKEPAANQKMGARNMVSREQAQVTDDNDIPEGFWTVARVDRTSDNIVWLANHASGYTDTDLIHWDSVNDNLYYYAAAPLPMHRQIHMVPNAMNGDGNADPVWVSQGLYETWPDRCGWIDMNKRGDNYIFNCRGGKDLPASFKKKEADMPNPSYDSFTLIENNEELANMLVDVRMPTREYGTFQSEKYPEKPYNFMWFKPYDFDENKKYKVVIEVYAGPEFQKVTDTWSTGVDFCQTMVSEYDILCASVDGRGSAFEGDRFMQQIYKKLGQYEPVDQTDFGKYLKSLPFVDENNIAIWGWSYGGYTTTHTLAYNNNNEEDWNFKCGVAVAPLASWRYYDMPYAERYMTKPQDNEEGYDKAEVWWHANENNYQGFRNSWYTLISGTADDNVHFMSPAHIEKKLVAADVDFDNFFYADEDHSIRSTNVVKYHVHQTIRRHLLNKRCLNIL